MNGLEKLEFVDSIGRELQSRMTFTDIYAYLAGHGIARDENASTSSKWVYVKEVLSGAQEGTIVDIAAELGIIQRVESPEPIEDANFWRAGYFRLFLSHISKFKVQTSRLQSALFKYGISSFVAHEDIEPSKEWQHEIEAGLRTCDALAALLMPGFEKSAWCDQEVGMAVARDVLVVPIRKGLDPYGFIGKYQGIQAHGKTVGQVASEIFLTLVRSNKTREKVLGSLVNAITQSTDIEEAMVSLDVLKSIEELPQNALEKLRTSTAGNHILMASESSVEEINSLLKENGLAKIGQSGTTADRFDDDIPF